MWPEVFEPTQVGSFREKVHPPTTEPGDGPFVCVRFNKDWLPYVLGGLFQLVNPSSWLVADDPSLQEALERASALLDLFGQAGDCPPMDLRFTDGCVLQYSLDAGATWLDVDGWTTNFPVCNPPQTQVAFTSDCLLTESFDGGETFEAVPGWAANFKDCVISNAPIIGLPPNPGDQPRLPFACSIAAYLADQVILLAMQKAVNAIQDDLTLLVFGGEVLTIIPEFVLVAAAYDAFASIYGFVAEGTLAHYEAAIADAALWGEVTCAIYLAIRDVGYVTPGNFGAILANLGAISYTYSDVVSAIVAYVTTLGATGLAQLSQRAGLLVGSDCGGCDTGDTGWGYLFDTSGVYGNFHAWSVTPPTVVGANGIQSGLSGGDQFTIAQITFPSSNIDGWQLSYHRTYDAASGSSVVAYHNGGTWHGIGVPSYPGNHVSEQDVLTTCDGLALELDTSQTGQAGDTYVNRIWIWGTGTCPFGTPNYHYPP